MGWQHANICSCRETFWLIGRLVRPFLSCHGGKPLFD